MTRPLRASLPVAVGLLLALLAGREAAAGPPTDQLKAEIDRVLKILDNPEFRRPGKEPERRAA